jgi:hypothetical protein
MTLIIKVNETHRIRSSRQQFVLERLSDPEKMPEHMKKRKGNQPPKTEGTWRALGCASRIHELWLLLLHKQVLALDIKEELPFEALHILQDAMDAIVLEVKACRNEVRALAEKGEEV